MYVSSDFHYLSVAFGVSITAKHYIDDSDILDVFMKVLCDVCVISKCIWCLFIYWIMIKTQWSDEDTVCNTSPIRKVMSSWPSMKSVGSVKFEGRYLDKQTFTSGLMKLDKYSMDFSYEWGGGLWCWYSQSITNRICRYLHYIVSMLWTLCETTVTRLIYNRISNRQMSSERTTLIGRRGYWMEYGSIVWHYFWGMVKHFVQKQRYDRTHTVNYRQWHAVDIGSTRINRCQRKYVCVYWRSYQFYIMRNNV